MKDLCVQYGCGFSAPDCWRNFDSSPTLRIERIPFLGKLIRKNKNRFPLNVEYGDIVHGLAVPEYSCKAVYCSHVLEHLSLVDFRIALRNTHRILQEGGIFRMVLPDLEHAINDYASDTSPEASYNFLKRTSLGKKTRSKSFKSFLVEWFGNSQHLWMWDFKALEQELSRAGFLDIQRASIGDSAEKMFEHVEESKRWENALGVECKK